jgi:putative glutamine amidotransferase
MKSRIIIGVSKLAPNYEVWLRRLYVGVEIINFYTMLPGEALRLVPTVSGMLLPGGSDIHPAMYGRAEDLPYCKDIDEIRDQLEKTLIERAFRHKIPLLGICRGHQVLNAVMEDVFHKIKVKKSSLLYKLTGVTEGMVNSAHHQAVNKIGTDLKASAYSADHLIEAIEAVDTIDHPFFMAVQWHPERMDLDNPLSGLVGRGFIEAAGNR